MDEDNSEEKTEIEIRAECKDPDMERQPSITENQNREDSERAAAGIKHYTGLPDYQTKPANKPLCYQC